MNFMFEWQTQYLTSERSERVRYCVCHENIKFISSSQRVMFFLLYGDKMSEIMFTSEYIRVYMCMYKCLKCLKLPIFILFSSQVSRNSLKTFKSYKVFFFVFSLSKLSENSFTCSSFSKTNLLATAIILNNTEATTHSVHSTK